MPQAHILKWRNGWRAHVDFKILVFNPNRKFLPQVHKSFIVNEAWVANFLTNKYVIILGSMV